MFILPLLSVQTLYVGDSVYTRRLEFSALRSLKAFRASISQSLSSFDLSKTFELSKPFGTLKFTLCLLLHKIGI
jgi:hypothetical protein